MPAELVVLRVISGIDIHYQIGIAISSGAVVHPDLIVLRIGIVISNGIRAVRNDIAGLRSFFLIILLRYHFHLLGDDGSCPGCAGLVDGQGSLSSIRSILICRGQGRPVYYAVVQRDGNRSGLKIGSACRPVGCRIDISSYRYYRHRPSGGRILYRSGIAAVFLIGHIIAIGQLGPGNTGYISDLVNDIVRGIGVGFGIGYQIGLDDLYCFRSRLIHTEKRVLFLLRNKERNFIALAIFHCLFFAFSTCNSGKQPEPCIILSGGLRELHSVVVAALDRFHRDVFHTVQIAKGHTYGFGSVFAYQGELNLPSIRFKGFRQLTGFISGNPYRILGTQGLILCYLKFKVCSV